MYMIPTMIVPCRGKKLILGAKQRSLRTQPGHGHGSAARLPNIFQHCLGKALKDSAGFFFPKTVKSYNPKGFFSEISRSHGACDFPKVPLPTIFGETQIITQKVAGYIFPTSLANYQSAHDCVYIYSFLHVYIYICMPLSWTLCVQTHTCIYVYIHIYIIFPSTSMMDIYDARYILFSHILLGYYLKRPFYLLQDDYNMTLYFNTEYI